MNTKQRKRQRDIKTKLMAAICMLLVSSIMMVSTTYAWFTLSTAPEVTGINTAVGANGNLEMALMPLTGDVEDITSGTADSMAVQAKNLANVTWGNLVDLDVQENGGTNFYGLDKITLYPSALNLDATGKIAANPLKIPVYGNDGRVASLATDQTFDGVYTGGSFYETAAVGSETITNPMGVRAIGAISGMTDRQLAFRAALAAASTAASQAQKVASDALKAEGPDLAGIAIEHATSNSESYSTADIESLLNMVNALAGYDTTVGETTTHTKGALELIEDAIKQYLIAAAASQDFGSDDYATKATTITTTPLTSLDSSYIPTGMTEMVGKLKTALTNAETAQTNLNNLKTAGKGAAGTDGVYAWSDIEDSLELLADPTAMKINGIDVTNLNDPVLDTDGNQIQTGTDASGNPVYKTNMSELVGSVMSTGINLTMASGAGVYADIADFTGDYSATIEIPTISYGGLVVNDVPATMSTDSTVDPEYLDQARTYVNNELGAPTGAGSQQMPISDYYGYIIDLAFRTNAADSYLQLQTEAVDRVYEGNTANEHTMGGGSTMSFKSDSTSFLTNDVLDLMKCIKIVFFDPTDNTIVSYATLNADDATTAADGTVTAELVLCTVDENGVCTPKTGDTAAQLMALEQNKAEQLSVLVYLDGNMVTNADVANAASSMTGTLNLQFSSSADLVPMEYTDLKQGNIDNDTPATPTITDVNVGNITEGYAATVKHVNGVVGAVITKDGTPVTTGTVTIAGQTATYTTFNGASAWTVTATDAPASVDITIAP